MEIIISILIGMFVGIGWGMDIEKRYIGEKVKTGECQIVGSKLFCSN